MKKIFFCFTAIFATFAAVAADAPVNRRGSGVAAATENVKTETTNSSTPAPTTARSAARAVARNTNAPTPAVAARVATRAVTSVAAPVQNQGVVARAATKKNVIQSGTGVQEAAKNVLVSDSCNEKYMGCMDSFCMLDNANGGRCQCSNHITELNRVLDEITKLDQQSLAMATTGAERITLGVGARADFVDSALAALDFSSDVSENSTPAAPSTRSEIFDVSSIFNEPEYNSDIDVYALDGLVGDDLRAAVHSLCVSQIPECSSDIPMLSMMYSAQIVSNCSAYENDLAKRRNSSAEKLTLAQTEVKKAALTAFDEQNKYDLGGCVVQMQQCFQDTERGGCGTDWKGCVDMVARQNAMKKPTTGAGIFATRGNTQNIEIKGVKTSVEIAASTYDMMMAKKPLCEGVLSQCEMVRDQVWDTFMASIAPALKSAELAAEADVRSSCISNISSCFQRSCKETFLAEEGSGSYDYCLNDPSVLTNACKVELDACGVSATDDDPMWKFVTQKLAAMRVDSCTDQVKAYLTSENMCGADYKQCVGLSTEDIIASIDEDALIGCSAYSPERFNSLVAGIMLNMDNNLQRVCQNAAEAAMINVCGDTITCQSIENNTTIGASTLTLFRGDANDDSYEVRGKIPWGSITISSDGKFVYNNTANEDPTISTSTKDMVGAMQNMVDALMNTINADTTVQWCMTGRRIPGVSLPMSGEPQYPSLTNNMRTTLMQLVLQTAQNNYNKKLNTLDEDVDDYLSQKKNDEAIEAEKNKEIYARNSKALLYCLNLPNTKTFYGNYCHIAAATALISNVQTGIDSENYYIPEKNPLVFLHQKGVTRKLSFNWDTGQCVFQHCAEYDKSDGSDSSDRQNCVVDGGAKGVNDNSPQNWSDCDADKIKTAYNKNLYVTPESEW
ncbi:MAG: hypothetical protein LBL75_01495 [Rickettsiales bacterium]|jgi:hypothetical protein|nr:hypothetical protein [Rickettsiales bacterium]